MKNKLLGYLLGVIIVLSTGFITSYVNADVSECKNNCSMQYGTNPGVYDCYTQCESAAEQKSECNGIKLNTNFPIIGNCIETGKGGTDSTQAFPKMIGALTKIVMALILVACFITIIVAGIMLASAGEDQQQTKTARDWIKRVAITILLLGFSGAILRLINPNFFG